MRKKLKQIRLAASLSHTTTDISLFSEEAHIATENPVQNSKETAIIKQSVLFHRYTVFMMPYEFVKLKGHILRR